MKIAQIAPLVERVPPKKYGGTERVIYELTESLVRRGHDVTLFATGDSITSARLISVFLKPLREVKIENLYGANSWSLLNIGLAYQMQEKFDIIHDHTDIGIPTANIAKTPVVVTVHGAFNENISRLFEVLNKNIHLVTISKAQGTRVPGLKYAGNVYNGLTMDHYPFSDTHDGYLLFVGRITREKGVHNAIEVAQRLDLPLIIAAKLETECEADMNYFYEQIEPKLTDKIQWIGEVAEEQRNQLMSKAMAFIHGLTWPEPFGLTLIESMACGTPVIAFRFGSIPELIIDGKTGFIVDTIEEMVQAVKKVDVIDRKACRKHALENFSADRMVQGYEQIYKRIIEQHKNKESNDEFVRNVMDSQYLMKPYTHYSHDIRLEVLGKKLKKDIKD